MLKLKKLTPLNLIWIENNGYWVYNCQTCGKIALERKDERSKSC